MREILFKGKRKENGKWVEGYYQKRYDNFENIQHLIFWSKSSTVWEYAEIDPETVCQYTGLNDGTKWEKLSENEKEKFLSDWNYKENRQNTKEDWKGRKIFEWDIVGIYSEYREECDYGIVKYGEFNCSCCSGIYGWYFEDGDIRNYRQYNVCGNIFDTPELIRRNRDNDYEPPITEEQKQEAIDRFVEEQENFRRLWKK